MEAVTRIFACKVNDLRDGETRRIEHEPAIALYKANGKLYATADRCTHAEWSLGEDGDLDGFEITCTLHMARFDIRDGRALSLPACRALRTFPVEVVGEDIVIVVEADR